MLVLQSWRSAFFVFQWYGNMYSKEKKNPICEIMAAMSHAPPSITGTVWDDEQMNNTIFWWKIKWAHKKDKMNKTTIKCLSSV